MTEETLFHDALAKLPGERAAFLDAACAGQIDTRADIYSLGVILYELLTGLRPIDAKRLKKAALTEMVRIIQEEEPAKPSTRLSTDESLPSLAALRQTEPRKLMALLRGELDWVVMKCLEKSRDRRYETANGLARDIQRYLADEAVEARPPSAGYRLGKFWRRNRGPVLAAALVLLAFVVGIVGTTLGWVEARKQAALARREADDKEMARQREAEQRALAEQANRQAYEALKSFTDELMEKVLGGRTKLTDNEKAILDSARKQWEVFALSKGDSPEARIIRADGAENLALVQRTLGMYSEAEANHRSALELRSTLASEFREVPRYRSFQARSHQNLGSALRDRGKTLEAEVQFGRAVVVLEQLVALDRLKRHTEALSDWDKAVELAAPDRLRSFRFQRADSLLRAGRVTEAQAEVEALARQANGTAEQPHPP